MRRSRVILLTALVLLVIFAFSACASKDTDEQIEVVYYTVSFNSAGGSEVASKKVVKDGKTARPEDPEREGYIFDCWTKGDEEWDFDYDTVTGDITLTAKWIDAANVYEYESIGTNDEPKAIITGVKTDYATMKIPTVINGLSVVGIGDAVFEDTSAETTSTIIIPESVTSIGTNAFRNCSDVVIEIEGALTEVGEGAFQGCSKLTSVTLGEGLTTIPSLAFSSCTSLSEIILPDSLTLIDENAFEECTALVSIILGKGIKTIADSAFVDCDAVKAIYYRGTEAQFDEIDIAMKNDCLDDADLYIYSETEPEDDGEYWYFDAKGRIKLWK